MITWFIAIYSIIGLGLVIWDFRTGNPLHDPPRFIKDRSVSTTIVFILLWPYKLLRKL